MRVPTARRSSGKTLNEGMRSGERRNRWEAAEAKNYRKKKSDAGARFLCDGRLTRRLLRLALFQYVAIFLPVLLTALQVTLRAYVKPTLNSQISPIFSPLDGKICCKTNFSLKTNRAIFTLRHYPFRTLNAKQEHNSEYVLGKPNSQMSEVPG